MINKKSVLKTLSLIGIVLLMLIALAGTAVAASGIHIYHSIGGVEAPDSNNPIAAGTGDPFDLAPYVIPNMKILSISVYTYDPVEGTWIPNPSAEFEGLIVYNHQGYAKIVISYESLPSRSSNNCVVYFNSMGGTEVPNSGIVYKGSLISEPDKPTKNGNTFAGWYTSDSYVKEWDFSKDKVYSSMTLFAKWTEGGTSNTGEDNTDNNNNNNNNNDGGNTDNGDDDKNGEDEKKVPGWVAPLLLIIAVLLILLVVAIYMKIGPFSEMEIPSWLLPVIVLIALALLAIAAYLYLS